MIERISKKVLTSPKLIIFMSTVVLISCIVSGFLSPNLLFHRESEEIAAKGILSPFSSSGENQLPEGDTVEEGARPKVMYTDIKGSVEEPGIYSFPSKGRVYDVPERAGGSLEETDSDRTNSSAKIGDRQVLYIPAVDKEPPKHLNQSASPKGKQSTADIEPSKINIDAVNPSKLQQIPGIGLVKVQEIIRFRKENGSLQKVKDLQKVSGIGEEIAEKLENLATVKQNDSEPIEKSDRWRLMDNGLHFGSEAYAPLSDMVIRYI